MGPGGRIGYHSVHYRSRILGAVVRRIEFGAVVRRIVLNAKPDVEVYVQQQDATHQRFICGAFSMRKP